MILSVCPNPSIDTFWFLDKITAGASHRVQKEQRYPGEKGVHVAMAVAELGEPSELLAFWAGANGEWLKKQCEEQNVICHGTPVQGESRICLTFQTEKSHWHDTEFLGTGPSLQPVDYEDFTTKYKVLLDKATVVVMSGSWPPGAPNDPYGKLIDLANERNIPVWLDCSGDVLQKAIRHQPFALHLNKKEAEDGLPTTYKGTKETYYLQFVEMLALTAGKDGLFLVNKTSTTHAVCHLEEIISAVGSGDCLTAGLAVAQHRGLDVQEMARLATACGSANCLRAALGMLDKETVMRLEHDVQFRD